MLRTTHHSLLNKHVRLWLRAIVSGLVSFVLAFLIVTLMFPHVHWIDNIICNITILAAKILWNVFIAPFYSRYL